MSKHSVRGLNPQQVEESRAKFGKNELSAMQIETFWDKLFENFKDPLIRILCVALSITLILAYFGYSEYYEAIGIASAVFIATFVSTWSEHKNETSFRDLQEQASKIQIKVFRASEDGVSELCKLPVTDIVVGDHVLLQSGDKVPGDGIPYIGYAFVDQASLTGESDPVHKVSGEQQSPEEHIAQHSDVDTTNINFSDPHFLFNGTVVDGGEVVLLICRVGSRTYYGMYCDELANKHLGDINDANNEDDEKTDPQPDKSCDKSKNTFKKRKQKSPLQEKLSVLANQISTVGYLGSALIALSFLFKKIIVDHNYQWDTIYDFYSQYPQSFVKELITAVILAIIVVVVAVPEGLPLMIAIVLSLNMRKLLKGQVLVRKLLGIETAGSMNLLFTDKTGTITKGEFIPKKFMSGSMTGFESLDEISEKLRNIFGFSVGHSTEAMRNKKGEIVGGNTSDQAILKFLDDDILKKIAEQRDNSVKVVDELLFSSKYKFAATQVEVEDELWKQLFGKKKGEKKITLIKGAPEMILEECKFRYSDEEGKVEEFKDKTEMLEELDKLSLGAMRLIAIATSDKSLEEILEGESKGKEEKKDKNEDNHALTSLGPLTLVGVVGIADEIRPEAAPAIKLARSAGVQIVMITGDRKETAIAVAKEIQLIPESYPCEDKHLPISERAVMTSEELKSLSDVELSKRLPYLSVVTRVLPTEKSRLVAIAQGIGKVVGMTGDGVNDAAALKQADVGFAMGTGSAVAKESADIVILDNNISSITTAVLYGRTIFKSIRKFIVFQATVNCAALLLSFAGPMIGVDFPLTLIQLLWVNMVMDSLAAIAFGGEPALKEYMKEPPIERKEAIISPVMWSQILWNGCIIGFLCIWLLVAVKEGNVIGSGLLRTVLRDDEEVLLTAFFGFFIFISILNGFNVRTHSLNIFSHLLSNLSFVTVAGLIVCVQVFFTEFGGKILRTVPLELGEWVAVFVGALVIIPLDLARKALFPVLLGARTTKHVQKKKQV